MEQLLENVEGLLQSLSTVSVTNDQRAEVAKTIAMLLVTKDASLLAISRGFLAQCKAFWRQKKRIDFVRRIEEIERNRSDIINEPSGPNISDQVEQSARSLLERYALIIDADSFRTHELELQRGEASQSADIARNRVAQALSRHSIASERFFSGLLSQKSRWTTDERKAIETLVARFADATGASVEDFIRAEKTLLEEILESIAKKLPPFIRRLQSDLLQAMDICRSRARKLEENAEASMRRLREPMRQFLSAWTEDPDAEEESEAI